MAKPMTPAERAAAMDAMPMHALYMTRGGQYALITQSYCEMVGETANAVTIQSVSGVLTIPREDVFAVKAGRLDQAEIDAVFAEHGHKQKSF